VLELSNSAPLAHAKEFTSLAQMCRTTGDIVDVWDKSQLDPGKRKWALGVRDIWNQHKAWEPFNRPGHWNMPCPLRVGLLGGWDLKPLRPTRLTRDEQYTHISLWCMWSAPLIIGCPLELLDDFTLQLLTNDEVLDLDQDPLGKQARQVEVNGQEFLVKDLEDGSKAVGLFNLTAAEATIKVRWSDLGIASRQRVRDLWQRRDLGLRDQDFEASVRPHGVVLIRVTHD
jgi:alpha-galactosidase